MTHTDKITRHRTLGNLSRTIFWLIQYKMAGTSSCNGKFSCLISNIFVETFICTFKCYFFYFRFPLPYTRHWIKAKGGIVLCGGDWKLIVLVFKHPLISYKHDVYTCLLMLYCFSFCKNNGCRCTSIQDYVGKYPHTIKCTELEKLTISTKTCINIRKLHPPPNPCCSP